MIAPHFERLAKEYSKPKKVAFAKINVDTQRDIARTYGVCPEEMWPYDISRFAERPPESCWTEAQKHLLTEYMAVDQTASQIEGCLAEGFPITFGFAVPVEYESQQMADTGIMPMPGSDSGTSGGGFKTAGRTLGGPATRPSLRRSVRWDINKFINAVIVFVGLYLVSLLSVCSLSGAVAVDVTLTGRQVRPLQGRRELAVQHRQPTDRTRTARPWRHFGEAAYPAIDLPDAGRSRGGFLNYGYWTSARRSGCHARAGDEMDGSIASKLLARSY